MQQAETVTFLGRLLTHQQTRRDYLASPDAVYDQKDLERQAQTLLNKRFSEIKRLIPRSASRFDTEVYHHFLDYADSYWPSGHRHHLMDALGFCEYLHQRESSKIDVREWNYIRFCISRKRFRINFIRAGVQILYQHRRFRAREWKIYWSIRRSK